MKKEVKIISALMALALSCTAGHSASTHENPNRYQTIPEKNVFRLKDSSPPTEQVKPVEPPTVPKLILNGITTILGSKMALMKLMLPAKTPGEAGEHSLMLREGERENDVEVLQINEQNGSVRVRDFGTILTLTFDKDGAKAGNAPLGHGPASAPGIPTPQVGAIPGQLPANSNLATQRNLSSRLPRLPLGQNAVAAPALPPPPAPITPLDSVSAPAQNPSSSSAPLTAEEQKVLNDFEQALNQQKSAAPPSTAVPPAPQ